ncbi:MAG TPA: hypothetical protein VF042_00310 [Gemmatimonadaceae bacterium]
MRVSRNVFRMAALASLIVAFGCESADRVTAPDHQLTPGPLKKVLTTTLSVTTVDQLYAAVNNPANVATDVLLAPGTYRLSATDGNGAARPNGGRLELQQDMSLYGDASDRSAVVIDAGSLPAASFNVSFGRTAAVRIGRGTNTIESLTIDGNAAAAAGIATELTGTAVTNVRVAHVLARGSSRGVDVRNVSAAMIGRRINAEIIDNEFVGPTSIVGMTEGIRLSNFVGADQGAVFATMSGNRAHGFQIGLIIASNRSSNAVLDVRSSGDRFFGNALGALITGGLSQATTGVANNNVTTFEAYGSQFSDNTADISDLDHGGLRFVAGLSTVKADATSNNTLNVALTGTKSERNDSMDFEVLGAYKTAPPGIAGTNNRATIKLNGVSKKIEGEVTDSFPADPAGTNSAVVIR